MMPYTEIFHQSQGHPDVRERCISFGLNRQPVFEDGRNHQQGRNKLAAGRGIHSYGSTLQNFSVNQQWSGAFFFCITNVGAHGKKSVYQSANGALHEAVAAVKDPTSRSHGKCCCQETVGCSGIADIHFRCKVLQYVTKRFCITGIRKMMESEVVTGKKTDNEATVAETFRGRQI